MSPAGQTKALAESGPVKSAPNDSAINDTATNDSTLPVALWVIPVSDLGGVARHVLDTAAVGIPGYRLVVLVPPGPLVERLQEAGVEHIVSPWGPGTSLVTSLRAVRAAIAQVRPQIVHSHLSYADIAVALVAGPRWLRRRYSVLTTEHGIAADDAVYHASRRQAQVMAAAHSARTVATDAYLAVAEATAEAMRHKWHIRRPIRVIVNGVDPVAVTRSVPDPQGSAAGPRVASISRLAPEKRIDVLIDAFAQFVLSHPQARLTLAGTGECEADLRAQVEGLGLREQVDFPGYVDATQLLARTDLVVQLSIWENCSYSLLDALSAGVPVVASAVGGNPEVVPVRGLVQQVEPEAVTAAMEANLGQSAQLQAGWPTRAQMTSQLAQVYDDLRAG